ncbi:glycine cleavage system protein GcvH [Motilimonas eburnea]|uniref:glycine cleavage system protein GcvH n=1 Tax=Motilimonas eburnea TaxID=1737488 RepID=UPI001E499FCF|nr:glycine cleavage system protein GcvH [Motilimonas eburnea]MCE2571006.1 glycine cleavage system protein GcvH [Motilimonas eburnea]
MSHLPTDLKYTDAHLWVRPEEDGTVTLGLTDHVQQALGTIYSLDAPSVGEHLDVGDECIAVEAEQTNIDIFSPISGDIIECNEDLADSPTLINADPYDDGWIIQVRPDDISELDDLMDVHDYQELIEEEQE